MNRLYALLLVVLAVVTLAPRTSEPLDGGWRAHVVAGNFERVTATKTLVVILTPGTEPWQSATLEIAPGTGAWTEVAFSDGCGRTGDNIVCEFDNPGAPRQIPVRVTVRTDPARVLGSQLNLSFGG